MQRYGLLITLVLFLLIGLWLASDRMVELSSSPDADPQVAFTHDVNISSQVIASSTINSGSNYAREVQDKLDTLLACASSEQCNYPQTDPKSYHYAVSAAMIELLNQAEQEVAKGRLTEDDLREFAHRLTRVREGHVQAAAIQVLTKLTLADETLTTVTDALADTFDAVLLEKSLPLLTRYHQQGYRQAVDNLLTSQLTTGGHFARQTLSARILVFINQDNETLYQSALQQLPSHSLVHTQLSQALREFHQLQTGG